MWRLLVLAVVVPGCFYVDPINERPSGAIKRLGDVPHRGESTTVVAVTSDPNDDRVDARWSVAACGPRIESCDGPFLTGTQTSLTFTIPSLRADGTSLVDSVAVSLEVVDSHGAIGHPNVPLEIDPIDGAPMVAVVADGSHFHGSPDYPIGLPITFKAQKSDPEDTASVTLDWFPFAPSGPTPTEPVWHRDPDIAADVQKSTLTPNLEGDWMVRVVATDPQQLTFVKETSVHVAADQPPCLGAMAPAVLDGALTVDAPRRFDVLTVDDDISAYPTPPAGSSSTTTFHWSMTPPGGGALVPLATSAGGVVVDPAQYAPGDLVDLRVDIEDAVARTLPCDASQPSCSIAGNTTCLQRQTWHLEMRP